MFTRKLLLMVVVLVTLSACNLARGRPQTSPTATTDAGSGRPVVTISSPEDGDEVVVNTDLFVSATASDTTGVTRVQLIANNQIVKTVSSESTGGDRNMNVLLDYRPPLTGDLTLEVIAYRGAVASEPATVDITVRANQSQVTATIAPQTNVPPIDPNDPTCRALTNVPLNVRTGPGTVYPRITTLSAGTQAPIVGRVGDNSWWQVRLANGQIGWVIQRNPANPNEQFISIFGNCSLIPIVNPPPTPTTTPPTQTHTPTHTPTATQPVTITPGPADLIIVRITGPTALTIPGGETSVTAEYSVTITNNGQANTGSFDNGVTVLPGGASTPLGVVSNLGANETISLDVELTFDAAGTYTIRATADLGDDVEELSEVNNTGSIDITVTAG